MTYVTRWSFPKDARAIQFWGEESRKQGGEEHQDGAGDGSVKSASTVIATTSTLPEDLDLTSNRESPFTYPIIEPHSQVRLVQFLSSSSSREIHAELRIVEASGLEEVDYTALSYTWGTANTPDGVHSFRLNGQPFYIRSNLWRFLQAYCTDYDIWASNLWYIDAVCIDQANVLEKGHQVKLQTRIYSQATEVLAWLGAADDADLEVHRGLGRLQSSVDWTVSTTGEEPEIDRALEYLGNRSYWTRAWIVQEALLAQLLVIRCGHYSFRWSQLESLCPRELPPSRFAVNTPHNGILLHNVLVLGRKKIASDEHFWRVVETRSRYRDFDRNVVQIPAFIALSAFNDHDCKITRDKLYSLLGLMAERDRSMVSPNYSEAVLRVYEVALRISLTSIDRHMEIGDPYLRAAALIAARLHKGLGLDETEINQARKSILTDVLEPSLEDSFERIRCPSDGTCLRPNMSSSRDCSVHGPEIRSYWDLRVPNFLKHCGSSKELEDWISRAPDFPEPELTPKDQVYPHDARHRDDRFAYDTSEVKVSQEDSLREIGFLGLRNGNPLSVEEFRSTETFSLHVVSVSKGHTKPFEDYLARLHGPHGSYYADPKSVHSGAHNDGGGGGEQQAEIASKAKENVIVHDLRRGQHEASCDHCRKHIETVRWRCLGCPDFDLCHSCYRAVDEEKVSPWHPHSYCLEPIYHPASISDDYVDLFGDYIPLNFRRIGYCPTDEMIAAFRDDPEAASAIGGTPHGGPIFPWCPRKGVEPPYWCGNLDVNMKPASPGTPHIRCLGLRLDNNDPLDAPPNPTPAGYQFYNQSILAGIGRVRPLIRERLGVDVLATHVDHIAGVLAGLKPNDPEFGNDNSDSYRPGLHFFIPLLNPWQALSKASSRGGCFRLREISFPVGPFSTSTRTVPSMTQYEVGAGWLTKALDKMGCANDVAWLWLGDYMREVQQER